MKKGKIKIFGKVVITLLKTQEITWETMVIISKLWKLDAHYTKFNNSPT